MTADARDARPYQFDRGRASLPKSYVLVAIVIADISKLTVKGKDCAIKDALVRKLGGTDKPIRLPFCVEKDGVRYSCNIADDAEGIDWVITKA